MDSFQPKKERETQKITERSELCHGRHRVYMVIIGKTVGIRSQTARNGIRCNMFVSMMMMSVFWMFLFTLFFKFTCRIYHPTSVMNIFFGKQPRNKDCKFLSPPFTKILDHGPFDEEKITFFFDKEAFEEHLATIFQPHELPRTRQDDTEIFKYLESSSSQITNNTMYI